MCAAIDTTLGAISSGAVHSRVGACDPRGLFAKRVLHHDSYYALATASLRYLIQKIWSMSAVPASASALGSLPEGHYRSLLA